MSSHMEFADQVLSPKALEQLLTTLSLVRGGDFSVRMTARGDGVEQEVGESVNELVGMLAALVSEVERLSEAVVQGELRSRMSLDKGHGAWGQIPRAINNITVTFGKHVGELRRVTKALHAGDTSRQFSVGPETTHRAGELAKAADDFNTMLGHVQQVTSEITRVFAEVGLDGRLNAQCHIGDASGAWGLLVGSVNAASASLAEQVLDLCNTAQSISAGNLSARATVTSRGDLQTLKHGLNGAAENLASLCEELRRISQVVCAEGKLSVEVRHPNPQGQWQSAQDAVNRMLRLLAEHWRSAAEQAERVLHGEYDATAQETAAGELGEPARGIAALSEQQRRTQEALVAMIEGRFAAVHMAADTQRDLALAQLAARLKREYFRATRGAVLGVRERSSGHAEFVNMALATVAQAVGAVAGAYYTVEGDLLARGACLGCEPHNDVAPLRVGEGLVGKVAATGEPSLLEDLDGHGVRVRSGLLELTPRSLLLYPIKQDSRVLAVVELLFLDDAAPSGRELLEFLGEEITQGPLAVGEGAQRIKALEEELVIANARIERLSSELQARERARAAAGSTG